MNAAPPVSPVYRIPHPLPLDSGQVLEACEIAYETYGTLAPDASNAVLVCHALTGDQYLASPHPITGKPGWWERMVGPGKPIDTGRHFVICANVIGSCMGSSGPASLAPDGDPYAMRFPVITIRDMVRGLVALLDGLGIDKLHAVVGGSMGGMQALSLAANWPKRAARVLVIASTARHSAQNIAFHEVGRQAIMADPAWAEGEYYAAQAKPDNGLAVARMAAHITYLSEAGLTEKFATSGIRAAASPGGSTRTPTSTSPARWITSTSPRNTAASWRTPFAAPRRGSALSASIPTGSTPPPKAATSSMR